ncbi:hypothetical protein GF108_01250 [Phyllobacterium sp. SYP-B3895]|uniref:Rap1a/Tai family immunity protein n=1 Tax=Phyllobacterium sp. SYP-B3895 TaxID=2663240 RepID=UPI0012997FFE|nr:Rap1a/Tai family immunity protein [Phyllobacterium sp. SYP-B3895]MRG54209.1 hypothetical protein [Phyllobacterium sp. SYP-B3895]
MMAASVAVGMMCSSGGAEAGQYKSGNNVLEVCEGREASFNKGACYGYITGVVDTYERDRLVANKELCVRDEVSLGQIVEVVIESLRQHPQNRDYIGAYLAITAIEEAFCSKDKLS